jgi:metal-sulfur cluster biosynthetic enzyme
MNDGTNEHDRGAAASIVAEAVVNGDDTGKTAGAGGDGGGGADGSPVTRERILEALKQVHDPELGINIVDLGLVYGVDVDENGDVDIRYSLTTMGCPIGPLIEDQIRAFLAPIEGLNDVRPELVFRPPWSPELMSDEAKAALGIF